MNENSLPKTQTIKDWLKNASLKMSEVEIPTPKLDSEIILADVFKKDRTYLHAHSDDLLNEDELLEADMRLQMRLKRIPVAYITGKKEFYGRDFIVSKATLIPRPESEDVITLLKNLLMSDGRLSERLRLVDIGTGSGCLGITAKEELPNLDVTVLDIDEEALKIAAKNAKDISPEVKIIQSNLLQNYLNKPDIIIANLPYVDRSWDTSPETKYEPARALFADNYDIELIEKLIVESNDLINKNGYLIIESDPVQHDAITRFALRNNFVFIEKMNYILAFRKG